MINSGKDILHMKNLGEIQCVFTMMSVKLRRGLKRIISIEVAIKTIYKHSESEKKNCKKPMLTGSADKEKIP